MEITKAYVTHGSVVTWASAAEVYQHFTLIASSIFSSSHRLLSPAPFGNVHCVMRVRACYRQVINVTEGKRLNIAVAATDCWGLRNRCIRICSPPCRYHRHRCPLVMVSTRNKVDIVRGNVLPIVVSDFNIVDFRVPLECPY